MVILIPTMVNVAETATGAQVNELVHILSFSYTLESSFWGKVLGHGTITHLSRTLR